MFKEIDQDDIRIERTTNGTEVLVFDPYNPINTLITKSEIETILSTYGINTPIHNYQLYKRAFIHRSYTKHPSFENEANTIIISPKPDTCLPLFTKSNERLEFIGDGVLECVTKYYLYKRFPKEQEGFMTEKKIALVKNESIGRIAYEMGLHRWFILSKHAEEKQTRVNLKKLGCLFEAFIASIFLDFNKIDIRDEEGWFSNVFSTGPGFQMAQIFIESVFEKHVNWMELIMNDDNYKNILQVKIQKEFKVTPEYMEISQYSNETGYNMGVFLCLGQPIHSLKCTDSTPIHNYNSFREIHEEMTTNGRLFILLGEGKHRIKKKAEQMACEIAVANLTDFGSFKE
jgi:dsRNA-specific ribonuclease